MIPHGFQGHGKTEGLPQMTEDGKWKDEKYLELKLQISIVWRGYRVYHLEFKVKAGMGRETMNKMRTEYSVFRKGKHVV